MGACACLRGWGSIRTVWTAEEAKGWGRRVCRRRKWRRLAVCCDDGPAKVKVNNLMGAVGRRVGVFGSIVN